MLFTTENILNMLLTVPGVIVAFTVKGWSQAYAADKLGDPTPRNSGRLTANPLVHIDLIGFLFILLFHFGWTKPVPVNTRNFKNIKRDNAIFILSGPLGCILAGIIAGFTFILFCRIPVWIPALDNMVMTYAALFFYAGETICITLAAFYLLPLPGLDGYAFIANLLPYQYYRKLYSIEKYSRFIFIAFILLIDFTNLGSIIFWPANKLIEAVNSLFIWLLP